MTILLPVALGLAAVWLLLPRPRAYPVLWGGPVALLSVAAAGWLLVRGGVASVETFLFYVFAGVAIVSGGLLVTQRNPVRAALSFALVVLSTCGLFLLQAAPFLMAATVIIYAGAIIVTFVFVIMLAQQRGISDADARSREPLLSCVAGFVLLGAILFLLQETYGGDRPPELRTPANVTVSPYSQAAHPNLPAENVAYLGRTLFTDYLLAVELGGTLLLVATIGAIAITARREEGLR